MRCGGRDGPECRRFQLSQPDGLCHDHSAPQTPPDSAHSVNSMACPNKALFMDAGVGISYHFQVPQNVTVLLTFAPFKNGNTVLSLWAIPTQTDGGPSPWVRLFHLQLPLLPDSPVPTGDAHRRGRGSRVPFWWHSHTLQKHPCNSFWEKSTRSRLVENLFPPDGAVLVFSASVCESRIWGSLGLTRMSSPPLGLSLRRFRGPKCFHFCS